MQCHVGISAVGTENFPSHWQLSSAPHGCIRDSDEEVRMYCRGTLDLFGIWGMVLARLISKGRSGEDNEWNGSK